MESKHWCDIAGVHKHLKWLKGIVWGLRIFKDRHHKPSIQQERSCRLSTGHVQSRDNEDVTGPSKVWQVCDDAVRITITAIYVNLPFPCSRMRIEDDLPFLGAAVETKTEKASAAETIQSTDWIRPRR